MKWRGRIIVDLSRDFLDTNGASQSSEAYVLAPRPDTGCFDSAPAEIDECMNNLKTAWLKNLQRLNVCSQKGLAERFDSTIGAGTVLMPFGGKYQLSPAEGMAAKLPVLKGDTSTGTLMAYGFDPLIGKWSPFHGAVYAVVEAVSRIVAMGGSHKTIRLTLQEYFEKLGKDPEKWGKPFSALLGAYYAQMKLGIPAIGGKDSMSGTFKDMHVPPTLVAFAVDVADVGKVISSEFKKAGSRVVIVPLERDEYGLPDFEQLDKNYSKIHELIGKGKVLSAGTVRTGGIAAAISRMCFGNMLGFEFKEGFKNTELFASNYGTIVLELPQDEASDELLEGIEYKELGFTAAHRSICINGIQISLEEALNKWEEPLERIFPIKTGETAEQPVQYGYNIEIKVKAVSRGISNAKPRIFMPVFPGTNCEYDTAKAFERAGGIVDTFVIRNLSSAAIDYSIKKMAEKIGSSQIIMLPGGFSGGDEPDGSGKFIATALRNPYVKEAVMKLLKDRDGLILGICNGFQALVKLGLVPYGEIRDLDAGSPTLTFNNIGRHVSRMVYTKVVSNLSPWFNNLKTGDIHTIAVSHGEGRFIASKEDLAAMGRNGQIVTQYVDIDGNPTYDTRFNPNGSVHAIEGITSPDGRVLGKMGHSERIGTNVAKNVPGEKDQKIFEAGVAYFE
jgi:phosphoribosylformylglycinamidine synthase